MFNSASVEVARSAERYRSHTLNWRPKDYSWGFLPDLPFYSHPSGKQLSSMFFVKNLAADTGFWKTEFRIEVADWRCVGDTGRQGPPDRVGGPANECSYLRLSIHAAKMAEKEIPTRVVFELNTDNNECSTRLGNCNSSAFANRWRASLSPWKASTHLTETSPSWSQPPEWRHCCKGSVEHAHLCWRQGFPFYPPNHFLHPQFHRAILARLLLPSANWPHVLRELQPELYEPAPLYARRYLLAPHDGSFSLGASCWPGAASSSVQERARQLLTPSLHSMLQPKAPFIAAHHINVDDAHSSPDHSCCWFTSIGYTVKPVFLFPGSSANAATETRRG